MYGYFSWNGICIGLEDVFFGNRFFGIERVISESEVISKFKDGIRFVY